MKTIPNLLASLNRWETNPVFAAGAEVRLRRLSGSFVTALVNVDRRLARGSSGLAGNRPGLGREARRVVREGFCLAHKARRVAREGFCLAHKARRLACEGFGLAAKGPGVACEGLGLARRRQSLAHAEVLRSRWG